MGMADVLRAATNSEVHMKVPHSLAILWLKLSERRKLGTRTAQS